MLSPLNPVLFKQPSFGSSGAGNALPPRPRRPLAANKTTMAKIEANVTTSPVKVFKEPSSRPSPAGKPAPNPNKRYLGMVWRCNDIQGDKPHPEVGKRFREYFVQIPLAEHTPIKGLDDPPLQHDLQALIRVDKNGRGRIHKLQIVQPEQKTPESPVDSKTVKYQGHEITPIMAMVVRDLLKRASKGLPPLASDKRLDIQPTPFPGYENGNGNGGNHPFTG